MNAVAATVRALFAHARAAGRHHDPGHRAARRLRLQAAPPPTSAKTKSRAARPMRGCMRTPACCICSSAISSACASAMHSRSRTASTRSTGRSPTGSPPRNATRTRVTRISPCFATVCSARISCDKGARIGAVRARQGLRRHRRSPAARQPIFAKAIRSFTGSPTGRARISGARSRRVSMRSRRTNASRPSPDCVPVFIVGMPRSGSTLVAELLSRHPDVRYRGELAVAAVPRAAARAQRASRVVATLETGSGDVSCAAAPGRRAGAFLHRQAAAQLPAHRSDRGAVSERAHHLLPAQRARYGAVDLDAVFRRCGTGFRLRLRRHRRGHAGLLAADGESRGRKTRFRFARSATKSW